MIEPSYLRHYHHFRKDLIEKHDFVAHLEANVVDLLIHSSVDDEHRDSSIAWEIKHQAGVTQMARVLAARRNLNPDVAAMGALLHDIYVITSGSYEDHARRGGPIAEDMISAVGMVDRQTLERVLLMVIHHSDKHIYDDNAYTELGKDVDTLDCFLYPNAIDEYLMVKPWYKLKEYLARAQRIWSELSLEIPSSFTILNDFRAEHWFSRLFSASKEQVEILEAECAKGNLLSPVAIIPDNGHFIVCTTDAGGGWLAGYVQGSFAGAPSGQQECIEVLWPHVNRRQRVTMSAAREARLFRMEDDR